MLPSKRHLFFNLAAWNGRKKTHQTHQKKYKNTRGTVVSRPKVADACGTSPVSAWMENQLLRRCEMEDVR